jgi:predicted RNase H-like HicB family nuclease
METIHLPLIIETDEDGVFIVSCPVFKGCHSYGHTVDEALVNIREVITMCMEEERPENLNRFVGMREIEVPVVRKAS